VRGQMFTHPALLLFVESGSFLHKMPDLPIVGQPERAVRARDDAPQVAHVKRATPVVEVSVGWERVQVSTCTRNFPGVSSMRFVSFVSLVSLVSVVSLCKLVQHQGR
jgi:hypothetical protein